MTGPTTNVATFRAVYRALGTLILLINPATIVVMSILFGFLFEGLIRILGTTMSGHERGRCADWLGTLGAVVLAALVSLLSGGESRRG